MSIVAGSMLHRSSIDFVVPISHVTFTSTNPAGETGADQIRLRAGAEGANGPGNSQANGPQGNDALESDHRAGMAR